MEPRILIVDDSLTIRMDLEEAFGEAGYRTASCPRLDAAREALAESLPDILVLDVLLPDGDGVALLAELRREPRTASLPVLLLSSEAEVADRIRGLTGGADAYVGKPYDRAVLLARAQALVAHHHETPGARPPVLVIDDSPTFREALAAALREAGYEVITAPNGAEGLRLAAIRPPVALVVDGQLPDLDGPMVIRQVRLDPGLSATPCLLLTASESSATEVAALDAGADAFVVKSIGTEMILTRLAAVLRAAETSLGRRRTDSVLSPKRILAVDDSLTYLELLALHLRSDGYEVVTARSGQEALDLLAVERVDCILLDVIMPGLTGTETCRRVKSVPGLRRIPLIMLTAREEHDAMVDGINAGADDYVNKSADFEVLRARLRAQLRRRQMEEENRQVRDALLRSEAETEAARRVADARQQLLDELRAKNDELRRLNEEMETFAYSVSHDLRQPLRAMDGFSRILVTRYTEQLDDRGRHYLGLIREGAQRMGELIDGLLLLSRVTRQPLGLAPARLDLIAQRVLARLREGDPARDVQVRVQPELQVRADPHLLESLMENLLGNAWKFTSRQPHASIEVGAREETGETVYFVRDDGAGFEMAYADKLFGVFQRLHAQTEFEGTGVGLATVQRIVTRHGGRIWAEGAPGRGATFSFTLGEAGGESPRL